VQGGKDAVAPRYINTLLSDITRKIFIKDDQHILNYLNDDGFDIEPEFYVPIIPMVLVNGAIGIGTGFSTNIPCFNPHDIISVIQRILDGEDDLTGFEISPWYRGFKGQIYKQGERWMSRGTVVRMSATKLEVRELPVGYWTEDFKIAMEEYYDKCPEFKSYESHYDEKNVRFVLNFSSTAKVDELMQIAPNGVTVFENEFKIISPKLLGTTNMYLFNECGQIRKYASAVEIIQEFVRIRLGYYQKRKDFLVDALVRDNAIIENKIRFIKAVIAGHIVVHEKTKGELIAYLETEQYMMVDHSFDYIIKIPIYNFTIDKVNELEEEYRKKCDELVRITNKTIHDMWRDELAELKSTLPTEERVESVAVVKRGRKATTT
jgi:DNA topoisomerase-2